MEKKTFFSIGRDDSSENILYSSFAQAMIGHAFLMPATVAPRKMNQDFIANNFDFTMPPETFEDAPGFLLPNSWELPIKMHYGDHSDAIDINIARAIEASALMTEEVNVLMLSMYEDPKQLESLEIMFSMISNIIDTLDENSIEDYEALNLDFIEGVVPFQYSEVYDQTIAYEFGVNWGMVWLLIFNQYRKDGKFNFYRAVEMMDKILTNERMVKSIIKTDRPYIPPSTVTPFIPPNIRNFNSNVNSPVFNPTPVFVPDFNSPSFRPTFQPSFQPVFQPDLPLRDFKNPILNAPGWKNSQNSCFYHATLAALFLAQYSPFPMAIFYDEDIVNRISPEAKRYREALMIDINSFLEGSTIACSGSREIFAQFLPKQDFISGSNEPQEFYSRFCEIFNYAPMHTREIVTRALAEDGMGAGESASEIRETYHLDTLQVWDERVERIRWDDSWTLPYENVHSNGSSGGNPYTWKSSKTEIQDADSIVVHLSRANPIMDSEGRFPDANSVDDRGIIVDDMMTLKNNIPYIDYDLKAVVFSPNDGHYAVMLNFDKVWYIYDDMNSNAQNMKVGLKEQTLYDAMEIIQTRGSLFFYYPRPIPKK